MIPAKFTPVQAASVAAIPTPLLSPSKRRILTGAAVLWCRDLVFPTVRALAAHLDRSVSSIANPFPGHVALQGIVIGCEWRTLSDGIESASDDLERAIWLGRHAGELASIDRHLLRLPSFVLAAMTSARAELRAGAVARMARELHLLAATVDRPHDAGELVFIARARSSTTNWLAEPLLFDDAPGPGARRRTRGAGRVARGSCADLSI